MTIEPKQITHLAKLAQIAVSEEEILTYGKQLTDIFGLIEKLSEVDVTDTEPTSHAHGAKSVMRHDVIKGSLPYEALAENAPDFVGGSFRVPKII